ncbi:MAG: hypothetical protein RIQ72_91, partial [Candidatus Parcubacteria bacterium]
MKDLYFILGMYLLWCIFWIFVSLRPLIDRFVYKREDGFECWGPPILALILIGFCAGAAHVLLWRCPSVLTTDTGRAVAMSFDQYAWWAIPTFVLIYRLVRLPYKIRTGSHKVGWVKTGLVQLTLDLGPEYATKDVTARRQKKVRRHGAHQRHN